MQVFKLADEAEFNPAKHVEKILGRLADGDFTVACWEPGQISPYHCHPDATEIYFCFTGGGVMRTPRETIEVTPGAFVVHPPGEVHEYANGSARTLLFRDRTDRCWPCSRNRRMASTSAVVNAAKSRQPGALTASVG